MAVVVLLLAHVFCLSNSLSLSLTGHYNEFNQHAIRAKRGANVAISGQPVQGYCIEIYIGTPPQKFSVVVDTGSGNFALSGGKGSGINTFYNTSQSSSFSAQGEEFDVKYVGGGWTGEMSQDVLQFCSTPNNCTTPSKVNVALITQSSDFFVNETLWQGILGLGFAAIAQPEDSHTTPVFDDLVTAGVFRDVFSMTLCGRERQSDIKLNGLLELGVTPTSPMLYTPLVRRWYYEVEIVEVRVNGKMLDLPCKEFNNQAAFLDSGTTNLILPLKFYNALVSQIRSFAVDAGMEITNLDAILARESYLCVADTDHPFKMFPELSFSLPVNATHQFNINIPPQQYIRQTMDSIVKQPAGYLCYRFGIELGGTPHTMLGAVFMERLTVVHDRANNRLGFTQADCTVIDPVFTKTVSSALKRTNNATCLMSGDKTEPIPKWIIPVTAACTVVVILVLVCVWCLCNKHKIITMTNHHSKSKTGTGGVVSRSGESHSGSRGSHLSPECRN